MLVRSNTTLQGLAVFFVALLCNTASSLASEEDLLGRHTPRGAVQGYLEVARAGNWSQAAHFLNLYFIDEADRERQGIQLARELKIVLDRTLWVDLEGLSNAPAGNETDDRLTDNDLVGVIERKANPFEVTVERTRSNPKIWLFSTRTVRSIPALYEEFGDGPIARWLPDSLVNWTIFETRLWQWVGALILLIAAYLTSWILVGFGLRMLRPWAARSKTDFDDRVLALTAAPLQLLVTVALFALGTTWFGFSIPARQMLTGLEITVSMFGLLWLIFRIIDLSAGLLESRFRSKGQDVATHFLPLSARALKIALSVVATLAALGSFGFDVTAIIAGLGVGGIAVALAAQKTIENVFGGVTVLLDQPVRPGDFCRYGDRIGTVEQIGIRSTRIRSLERTVVTVPNSEFAVLHLENFAKRDRILIRTVLGLRYETKPDQLRHVMEEIRTMLKLHPRISDQPRRVQLVAFGASSLDIEMYCYVESQEWEDYLSVREDVFLRIIDIVDNSGSGFAFPSQTTYIAKDDGLDSDKSEAALAQIAEWRSQGKL